MIKPAKCPYKQNVFAALFLLLIIVSGCSGKKSAESAIEDVRKGTQGITFSFLPNNPPDRVYAEEDNEKNKFDVVLELRNSGAYPQPDSQEEKKRFTGNLYLSGYDPNLIDFKVKEPQSIRSQKNINLEMLSLEGKSTINPNGGQDIASFEGKIDYVKLNVDKYEPTLLATACYHYETSAGPAVCIDPNPYSTVKEKKICDVKDIILSNQGAPIAVVKINEEAFAQKTLFKITIKNVGSGDVIKDDSIAKCDPLGGQKIERGDVDKVKLNEVRIADIKLSCGPFADVGDNNVKTKEGGLIRLISGEGYIICELSKEEYGQYKVSTSTFTTPLLIKLAYGYRTFMERKLQIKKEPGSGQTSINDEEDIV